MLRRVLMSLVAVIVLVPTIAGSGCIFASDSTPACVPDAGVACVEAWCGQLVQACEKRARLCGSDGASAVEQPGECNEALCAEQLGEGARQFLDPAGQVATFMECIAKRSVCDCTGGGPNCLSIRDCFEQLRPPQVNPINAVTFAQVLPTHIGVSTNAQPAGVVVLPGDDLACLQCALASGGCAELTPDCFTAAPVSSGATDSCLDYRTCLRMCQEGTGTNSQRYELCAASICDAPAHGNGRATFLKYQQCMLSRCASCFAGSAQ